MIETRIEAVTADGAAPALLLRPEGEGPWPMVVLFHDAGGPRAAMTTLAAPLVAAGFAVLEPDLLWRSRPFAPFDWQTVFTDPEERQRLLALLGTVRAEPVMAELLAQIAAIPADAHVRTDRFGCYGFCLGGRMSFLAATALPERVVAAASIHGGGLVSPAPDSPHRGADRIQARLYLAVADQDRGCTPEQQRDLAQALDAAGVDYELELYPGALHGFAVEDFPVHDAAATRRQQERSLALFEATLR